MNPIPALIRGLIVGGWAAALVLFENRRALRRARESKIVRDLRNLGVASLAGVVLQLAEIPVAFHMAQMAQQRRWGVLGLLHLPPAFSAVAGVLALDYTLYWWHFLTHRVPLLWRFHQVHHVDLDMDASTGLRFHFGEIAISVLFRAAQVRAIGPSPFTFALWQVFVFLCILFHHSNVRLPLRFERLLAYFIVTPRLHGIHHSIVASEVNSNWSSGLTIWDRLHRTLRTRVAQAELTLGVAGLQSADDARLARLLALPFRGAVPVPAYDERPVVEPIALLAP